MSVAFSMESRNLLLTSMAGWTYAVGTLGKRRANILVNAAIAELILARGNLPVSQEFICGWQDFTSPKDPFSTALTDSSGLTVRSGQAGFV